MSRKKKSKRWLFGITIALLLLVALGYLLIRTVYLPGVHFIGRYCSVNETFTCYWYNEERKEFTGETSEIFLKANGFSKSSKSMFGTLEIEGYEMEKKYENGSDVQAILSYDYDMFSALSKKHEFHYAEISYVDYYIEYTINAGVPDSRPAKGYEYILYFYKENTDYIRVVIRDENGRVERVGYCAGSLEEANAVQQHYQNWK